MTNGTRPSVSTSPDLTLFEHIRGIRMLIAPDPPRYTILAASKDLCTHVACRKEDLTGKSIFEAFPPNLADNAFAGHHALRESLDRVLNTGEEHRVSHQRYDIINAEGKFEVRYWDKCITPVPDSSGEIAYIIHQAEDTTNHVVSGQLQQQMKGMEQAYNLLLHAPLSIAIFKGKDYIIELANPDVLAFWGKDPDVVGKPLEEVYPELSAQGFRDKLEAVRKTGESFQATEVPAITYRNGQPETAYFDVVYQPYYNETGNEIMGVFTLSHEVTKMVAARRKVEEARLEADKQKRLYETIINATPDLIYVFDLNYRFTYANKALLQMWGTTWEEAQGRGLLELGYEPWHATMHEREIDAVVATKKSIRGEVTFPHATLGQRLYDYIFVPVFNASGEVEAVAGTTRDITDLKKAEQDIRESEQRFSNLADESPIFVFIIDPHPDGPVNYWNRTWLQYTGQTPEQARGYSWNEVIHPDDIARILEIYAPAFQNQASYFLPAIRVKRYDGVYRWHAFKGNPRYLPDGTFNGYVGVGFDIHEQKLSEERIKQSEALLQVKFAEKTEELKRQTHLIENILSNSSNGISVSEMIRNSKGEIVDASTVLANEAAVVFTGLPKDIYLSKTARELDPHILESEYGKTCLRTLETGQPALIQYFLEYTGRWLELTISKMDDDHLIHIFTDITPIKEAQLQLEKTVEELKRSNVNLEEFAYAASHDLKEPIRKIHFFSDRLKGSLLERLTPDERIAFDKMESASKRMSSLIDDLLAYSQVSHRPKIFEKVNLNHIIALVLEDLDLEIEEKGAVVTVAPLFTIDGQQRQLQQAFQNLISNALKYSKPGVRPVIKISSSKESGSSLNMNLADDQQRIFQVVTLEDNGIGFEQGDAERIFNVFTRLHGNTEFRGTGIGLSIVRKVIENHQGYITAEGRPGEGATFKIYLPVALDIG